MFSTQQTLKRKMIKLEKQLIDGVFVAKRTYSKMTGYGLWHAPEVFLSSALAMHLSSINKSCCVYPECSPKAIQRDHSVDRLVGRPLNVNEQQRFDLLLWWANESPRCIVELKMTYAQGNSVKKDGEKLLAYSKEARRIGLRSGYLLVYSHAYRNRELSKEVQGRETLAKRFQQYGDALQKLSPDFQFVGEKVPSKPYETDDSRDYYDGAALYKLSF